MLHPSQLQLKPSERKWASSELAFKGFGDGSERVRGYRQMFGHVGTLGGTRQERGPPQVSRLATQPHYGSESEGSKRCNGTERKSR